MPHFSKLVHLLCLLILILGLGACKNESFPAGQTFHGYWAETRWEFDFLDSEQYVFACEGHYATKVDTGRYFRHGDTLFLTPSDSRLRKDGVVAESYLIDTTADCIIDIHSKYDYCRSEGHSSKFRSIEYPQQPEADEQTVALIDSLMLVALADVVADDRQLSATDTLVLSPYFRVGRTFGDTAKIGQAPVRLFTSTTDTLIWSDPHAEVREINFNPNSSVSITLTGYGYPWKVGGYTWFEYMEGRWVNYRDIRGSAGDLD